MKLLKGCIILLILLFTKQMNATVYHAQASGNWELDATWLESGVPGVGDHVIIDGFKVEIKNSTGDVTVQSITVLNSSLVNTGNSELFIDGAINVYVLGDVIATADNVDKGVELKVRGGAVLSVDGNMLFTRTAANSFNKKLILTIEENTSAVVVDGKFIFDYQSVATGENNNEVFLNHQSTLTVMDSTIFYLKDGADFDVLMKGQAFGDFRGPVNVEVSGGNEFLLKAEADALVQIGGATTITDTGSALHSKVLAAGAKGRFTFQNGMTLKSGAAGQNVILEAENNDNKINVTGNIVLDAQGEDDVQISLRAASKFYISGNFNRPNNYGSFFMGDNATLYYSGTTTQELATPNKPGSGSDVFNYTNVVLQNNAGFSLEDTMLVIEHFELQSGIINTTELKPMIIADNALITGGSSASYVNGPLVKRGRSSGSFLFPIGDAIKYAPLEISELTDQTSEYTALFRGDPPPFGENGAKVNSVHTADYWSLNRSAGSADVDVTLHWESTLDQGYTEMDELIIVGLDENDVWKSYGNGGTTGSVGVDSPGSVMSLGDPPPFGINNFAIGTVVVGSLPVELIHFDAMQKSDKVYLNWQTASEINTSRFIVERSQDGDDFEALTEVWSRGESSTVQSYTAEDVKPYAGRSYYRLKIEDKDGTYEYSSIRLVSFRPTSVVRIYPNPVIESIHLDIGDSMFDTGMLEIFDQSGKQVYTAKVLFENGLFRSSAEIMNVSQPGVYTLRVMIDSEVQVIKFIKMRN